MRMYPKFDMEFDQNRGSAGAEHALWTLILYVSHSDPGDGEDVDQHNLLVLETLGRTAIYT